MKKPLKFMTIASVLLLTACGAKPSSSVQPPIYDTPTEAALSASSSESEKEEGSDNSDGLVGYGGEALEREKFEKDPNDTNPNSQWVGCEVNYGFTALFDGNIYNSYDDPEKFDFENWECTESCEAVSGDLFIIGEGDNAGGLTCSGASSYYCMIPGVIDDPHLYRSLVCFDGEVEVTGYVNRCDGDEAYMEEGQLLFYPDESWRGLPVPCEPRYFTYHMNDGGFVYAPFMLSLGTIYDYSALGLEHDIPQGASAHMRLVLGDIALAYGDGDFSGFTISSAVIVSAEKID